MCDCYSLLFTPYHMHARNISDVWCIIAECNSGCLMCACSVRIAGSLLCYTMLQRSALGVTLLYVVSMNKICQSSFCGRHSSTRIRHSRTRGRQIEKTALS